MRKEKVETQVDERRESRDRGQEACAVGTRRRHAHGPRAGTARRGRHAQRSHDLSGYEVGRKA